MTGKTPHQAQEGKFTLPFETQWSQAVLPAGALVVAFESVDISENGTKGESVLLVGRRGTQHVVYSLRIAELGETFVYERPSYQRMPAQGGAVEAHETQAISVLMAKK